MKKRCAHFCLFTGESISEHQRNKLMDLFYIKKIIIKYVSMFIYAILIILSRINVTGQVNLLVLYKTFISNYAR